MPELPEVETVMRGLKPVLEGRRLKEVIQRRADLRFPLPKDFAQRLTGRKIISLGRRAKYITAQLDGGETLICHLGMSGRMTRSFGNSPPFEKHDHIIFRTDQGHEVRFNDHRRFGMMDLTPSATLADYRFFKHLGPEPLSDAFSSTYLSAALKNKSCSIKTAILDQKLVVGVGNIYAAEALYFAGISPKRLGASVAGARAIRLVGAIKEVLTRAIAAGGSSLRDYVQADGELGYFQHAWAVYGKEGEGCPDCTCTKKVQRITQGGRSTFYCALHQR